MKSKVAICCLITIGVAILMGCTNKVSSPQIENVIQDTNNTFTCSFDGVKHDFILDLPVNTVNAPLIVMLHGYGGTAESFRSTTHLEQEANPLGYGVVYVTGAPNPGDATSAKCWNSGIGQSTNKDVEFLVALAKYLQNNYSFDPERTYAVGFSNGAFMVHRLGMEASSTFSAVVSVAGMMPETIWDTRKDSNSVSIFQITGEKDDVVPKHWDGSAKYSQAPAIEDVMEYWATSNDLALSETDEIGKDSILTKYTETEGQKQVWHLFVKDGRHSWPSEDSNGINTNTLILDFFENQ